MALQTLRMMQECGLQEEEQLQEIVYIAGNAGDVHTLRAIQEQIKPIWLQAKIEGNPFTTRPKGNQVDGDIHIGDVIGTGARFGLKLALLVLHMFIVGASGSGKTNLLRYIIKQLVARQITFFLPDLKDDFSSIGRVISNNNLLITKPVKNELQLNPFEPPPGVPPVRYLQIISEVLAQCFGLMIGSKTFIMAVLDDLYRAYGVYSGKAIYPSLHDFYDLLKKIKVDRYSRDARFRESCIGRTETILITLGDVFDCSRGFPLPELIRTNWVLQLHGLAGFIQNFFVLFIMAAIYMYRICNNIRSNTLDHCFILDEGKRFADRNLERIGEIPYTDLLISQIREFGTGCFLADQEPKKIAASYRANTYTKIAFGLGDGADILDMARCMSLNRDQMEYFSKLKTGEAIVRYPGFPHPFLIQVPYVPH